MILEAVQVNNWRGLSSLELSDLNPRINLVLGANESGKSTLFEAIRFALFESSRGRAAHKQAIQPWHNDTAPEVDITFTIVGNTYRVFKRFLKNQSTRLVEDGGTTEGEEAEERLRDLLGVRASSSRRPADVSELGLFPLLWVSQGEAATAIHASMNADSRERLGDILAREVDAVAAGPLGTRIQERVEQQYRRYWTPTGRETGELKTAHEQLSAAREQQDHLEQRLHELRSTVDRLDKTLETLAGIDPRLRQAAEKRDEARKRRDAAEQARNQRDKFQNEARALELDLQSAEKQRRERTDLAGTLEKLHSEQKRVTEDEKDARRTLEEADVRYRELGAQVHEKETALKNAVERLRQARRAEKHADLSSQRRELDKQLESARELEETLQTIAGELATNPVTPEALKQLRKLHAQYEKTRAKLEGAAARVSITARRELRLDDEDLKAGESRQHVVSGPRTFVLDDIAELYLEPGGEDLGRLRQAAEEQRDSLHDALAQVQCEGLGQAETVARTRENLLGKQQMLDAKLNALAPDGTATLRNRLAALQAELEAVGPAADEAPPAEEAEQAETLARNELDAIRSEQSSANAKCAGLRERLAGVKARTERVQRDVADVQARLGALPDAEELESRQKELQEKHAEAAALAQGFKQEYERQGGEQARQDAERLEKAVGKLQNQKAKLQGQRNTLEQQLEMFRGESLHEEIQDAETACNRRRNDVERIERQANAVRELKSALDAARTQYHSLLIAPVRQRVDPYLQRIFPDRTVALSEKLELEGLTGKEGGPDEVYEALSFGAREQVSLMTRLAVAEVLSGEERLPVVLDDALVNTDLDRLNAMIGTLYQAADHLQLILLTCHEAAYDLLAPDRTFRLPALRHE